MMSNFFKREQSKFLIVFLSVVITACGESVIFDEKAPSPHLDEKSRVSPMLQAGSMTFKFKLGENFSDDLDPVEALFPGQSADAFEDQDLESKTYNFDFIVKYSAEEISTDKKRKVILADGKAKISLEAKASNKDEEDGNKKSRKSKTKEKSVRLKREFKSDGDLRLFTKGEKDFLEGKLMDIDEKGTRLLVKAERQHSPTEESAMKNSWKGRLVLVEDGLEMQIGEISGYFFQEKSSEKQ